MNTTRKLISLLIVIALLVTSAIAAFAAGSGAGTYEAGSSVTVGFNHANETGVEGTITFSNPGIFAEDVKNLTPTITGTGVYNAKTLTWMGWLPSPGKLGISFNLTIKDTAKAGETCTITHKYTVSIDNGMDISEERTESVTITVKAKPQPSEPKPTEPKPTQPKPTEPKPTQPKPTEPKPTEPKPTQPGTNVDYTELNEQIQVANGLSQGKYTAESWKTFADALANANNHKWSKDQAAVDAAAKKLQDAIAALAEMDYSKLVAAMDKVTELTTNDELADLFRQLFEANAEGKQLLSSGDQAAVDAGAAKIEDLLKKIAAKLEELGESEIVYGDKEVEVEVMPGDDYCNIHMHKVWPILFWISLALNLCFIALVVIYFVRKKQNQKDNTPLVDYDISDDEE